MHISSADFAGLVRLQAHEARAWLRQHQPRDPADRGFWWENLITQALQAAYHAQTDVDRREAIRLVRTSTEEAVDRGIQTRSAAAIRIANLCSWYLSSGEADDSLFDVNAVVAGCLDLIAVPLDEAIGQLPNWRALRIEQIRVLREAKNLVRACRPLAGQVTDPETSHRLSNWLEHWDRLP